MDKELALLLGIRKSHKTDLDLARIVEEGLPAKGLDRVKKRLNLSEVELSHVLAVSKKKLYLLRNESVRLKLAVGDRLARMARIAVLAEAVLESRESAEHWLRTEQVGLGGEVPLDLIRTEVGAREIERLLGRIEYGVLS